MTAKTARGATTDVYLESGSKRIFACAVEWPGWARRGNDEASALAALVDYAPRYVRALARKRIRFVRPAGVAALRVVARYPGSSSADFGTPGVHPKIDERAVTTAELRRLITVLETCWAELDAAAAAARGRMLAKGPRGVGARRDPRAPSSRREALDGALLRAPQRVALARPRLGDRRPSRVRDKSCRRRGT